MKDLFSKSAALAAQLINGRVANYYSCFFIDDDFTNRAALTVCVNQVDWDAPLPGGNIKLRHLRTVAVRQIVVLCPADCYRRRLLCRNIALEGLIDKVHQFRRFFTSQFLFELIKLLPKMLSRLSYIMLKAINDLIV